MITVAVIVPCFNGGKTISKTIESLKNQTYKQLEIIIVDDGSTDEETIMILDAFEGVELVRQKNKGLAAARNVGISRASSELILLLDSDDWLEPDALDKMVSKFNSVNENCFIFNDIVLEGDQQGIHRKKYNFFEQLFLNQIPYSIMLPRNIFSHIGGYDENMKLGYEDWEFNIRLGISGYHGVCTDEPLFHYLVSKYGMLKSKSNKSHIEIWLYIRSKHAWIYRKDKIWDLWVKWHKEKSNHNLLWYLVLFICSLYISPNILSNVLFKFKKLLIFFKKHLLN